jgi:hypothetical protein
LSVVQCIVAGAEIGARECVDRQHADRCFCPKAPLAISEVKKIVLPGTRLEDVVNTQVALARSLILKPHAERFLGPALVVLKTGKAPEPSLIAGELPAAPPKREDRAPLITARPDRGGGVKSGERRDPPIATPSTPPPRKPDPATVAAAVEAQRAPAPAVPAPSPAKEKSMPPPSPIKAVTDDDFRKAYEQESGSIIALAKRFGAAAKTARARVVALGLEIRVGGHIPKAAAPAKSERKPRATKPRANGHAKPAAAKPPPIHVAQGADALEILEQHLAHHQAQVARFERAIAALRE